jgi:hypothetical protein
MNCDTVSVRMRDALFGLRLAQPVRASLNKTELQKSVYLVDAVSLIYSASRSSAPHVTYNHGPYDKFLQRALDVLLFRGLLAPSGVRLSSDSSCVYYSLTSDGEYLCDVLSNEPLFTSRWKASWKVVERLNAGRWNNVVDLVYAEPSFVGMKRRGRGLPIDSSDSFLPTASRLFFLFRQSLEGFNNPSEELLVDMFFDYLERYNSGGGGRE